MRDLFAIFIISTLFISCTPETVDQTGMVDAYVPVYATSDQVKHVSIEAGRPVTQAGKIYAFGSFIFQNDVNKGIHIINNSNRNNPVKVAFINIPLSTEVAVKGNFLFSNNYRDIVVFDITNPASPVLVKRMENVFPPVNQHYPPQQNISFECPDPEKGVVVNWEFKKIENPTCRR